MRIEPLKYRAGYKYQLAEDETFPNTKIVPPFDIVTEFISLTTSGDLRIKAGYAWDGASGPTWDTKSTLRASLAHDGLYQLMRELHLPQKWRSRVDTYFGELLKEDGMWAPRRLLWVREVKKFASSAASPNSKKLTLTAP